MQNNNLWRQSMNKQLSIFSARRLIPPLLAALALSACGSDDDPAPPPQQAAVTPIPFTPEPESTRAQDGRTFSVVQTQPALAALSGAPETDRWTGVLNNASYQVEVPKNWN